MSDTIQLVTLILVSVMLGIMLIWISCKLWKRKYRDLEKSSDDNYHYMSDKNLFKGSVAVASATSV
jgi:predicted tellurium resistance membrane protein TerC